MSLTRRSPDEAGESCHGCLLSISKSAVAARGNRCRDVLARRRRPRQAAMCRPPPQSRQSLINY